MKKKEIIVIVDMQNDFITGVLGSKEAEVAVQNAIKYLEDIKHPEDTYVIFTQDTHFTKNSINNKDWYYETTSEGRHLPILHCEDKTEGWEIHKGLYEVITSKFNDNYCTIQKASFMVEPDRLNFDLGGLLCCDDRFDIDKNEISVTIFGLCTDICVISNALLIEGFIQTEDANSYANVDLTCIANCCAGSTPEKHEAALSVMESCHIKVVR